MSERQKVTWALGKLLATAKLLVSCHARVVLKESPFVIQL